MRTSRRRFLGGSTAITFFSFCGTASISAPEPDVTLKWSDLVPESGGTEIDRLRSLGIVQHGQLNSPWDQETAGVVTNEFDGLTVRIPGYVIPLDFEGTKTSEALLVPYVGACIHVPPPPPNQLIYVQIEEPYQITGLFEPVWVTGRFSTYVSKTALAEVGYAIDAGLVEPYA